VLDAPAAARVVYPDQAKDVRTAKAIIKIAEQIFAESANVAKFFKSPVHLYSLFIVIYLQRANKQPVTIKRWASRLETFAEQYKQKKQKKPPVAVARYKAAATEGTQKRSNREDRVRYLRASILGS
jgi:hypothetical protein